MAIVDQALLGKVALVTGASRGIGRAIALALAQRGARVAVGYREREDSARRVVAEIEALGGEGRLFACDVADASAVSAAVTAVATDLGQLDILVNNAGLVLDNLLLRTKDVDWSRTLDVNLSGVFAGARAACRYLLKAKDAGRIINLTSVVGEMGNAGQVAYASAKAGVIGLTKALARELAPRGITVNAIAPGLIATDMTAESLNRGEVAELLERIPLKRVGRPEDVADVAAFLAGPEGAYITGQVIRVNGGLLM